MTAVQVSVTVAFPAVADRSVGAAGTAADVTLDVAADGAKSEALAIT